MSREIEERVVSMQFDNANFERNVKSSMSTLEKLRSALNFKGASKGIEAVEKASNKINFNGLTSAIDNIGVRFSSLQVIGTTALANITNAAVNAGRTILNSLTLQPITSGFAEYETQIGSIQTILSNTRWQNTSLDQVNSALDQLNEYADQTIYNFTEMTRNIGTFTAAGVGLDQSVAAIKGIANLAAVSGSSSQQASQAMYQLSQALAAGRVSLMDWNSVNNAGMGGKIFQDALVRTSELMGTGAKQAIETYGNFRESLTKGQWLTADVLTETLKQISGAYTEADLISQGYTQEQAAEIVALAEDATDAATKVRTFSQLMGTTMEQLGSGWTSTWEILIGDFNEATEFWTNISNAIGTAVTESANARNQMLQEWVDMGGRQNILDGLTATLEGLSNIITPIKEAFSEIFPPVTAQTLLDISTGFENLMVKFRDFSAGAAPVVKDVFTAIFSVLKSIGSIIGSVASGIGEFFGVISSSGGDIGSIISQLAGFVTGAANAVTESGALTGVLTVLGNAFGNVLGAITELLNGGVSKLGSMFSGVGDILSGATGVITEAVRNIATGIGDILGTADFGSIIDVFNSGMLATLIASVKGWFDSLTGGVEESTGGLIDSIKDMVGGISDNVTGVLDSVRGSLETWQTNIKTDILLKIAVAVAVLVAAITILASIDSDRLTDSLGAITVLFVELIGAMTAFTKLNTNLEQLTGIGTMIAMAASIAILASAMKSLSELDADAIERGMVGIAGLATVMVAVTKALSSGGDIAKGAIQLVLMAAALKIMASVAIDMSKLDWESLGKGLLGVGALMTELAAFSRAVKSEGLAKVAISMVLIGASMEILQDVIAKFGNMKVENILTGLGTMGAALAEFAVFTHLLPKGSEIVKTAAGIMVMSLAFSALEPVMASFAGLGLEGIITSVVGVGGALGALTLFMKPLLGLDLGKLGTMAWVLPSLVGVLNTVADATQKLGAMSVQGVVGSLVTMGVAMKLLMVMIKELDKIEIGDMAAVAVALPLITDSLNRVADAMLKLSGIDLQGAASAVIAVTGAMGALFIGIKAVEGKTSSVAALMLVSVALVALASAIVLISNSGIVGVATSFVALAGAMTIVGVAAKILKPLIPSMFSLAGSLAAFGGSLVVLGIGTAAVGVGLAALMTSLAAGIAALVLIDPMKAGQGLLILAGAFMVIGVAAKLLKPMIGSILQLSASLLSFAVSAAAVSISIAVLVAALTALGSIGSEGAATIVSTLRELILGISEMIPELITNLMDSFKTLLLGLLDALVEIAPQLADGIFQILSQTIQSSLEYMPEIAGFFIDFLIQMLNTVRERLPELFPAVTGLIGDLIKMIMEALGQWQSTGNSIEMAVGIFAGMIGLVVLLNFIKGMIPGAMVGLLGLAAFVVEFGAILTALGALQQLTGAASFINSAGDLLQSIGTAIGQFIGGLVGGFAEGATSTLPQVGTNLSQFAMNIMPFLIAMQMVDQKTIDGVTNLALAIAALAGANFVDAVTTFLSGGQDFGDLGAKLIPFGEAMVQFSSIVSGIDVDAINASAACGQALAALATSLPKEGGLAQAIFGETVDMGTFATQMVAFGMALRMYATAVSGVDFGPVQESAVAGQALSDLASTLPKEGGLAQAIFGETTDMDKFGAQMVAFGLALKLYAMQVAGLNVESIQNSVTAGQALSDLANALPNEGGLAEWIFGGSDLGSFGETLAQFGDALNEFSESVAGVDTTQILAVTARVRSIKDLMADSAALDMTGLENLKRMGELSDAYVDFYGDASSIDTGSITSHINALKQIRDFLTGLTGLDFSGANSFVQSVTDISNIAMNGITSTFEVGSLEATGQTLMTTLAGGMRLGLGDCTQAARDVIQGVCDELGNPGSVDIPGAGTSVVNKFAEGIKNNIVTATGAVNQLMSSAIQGLQGHYNDFFQAGVNLAEGFASGISTSAYKAKIEAAAMANAAASAAKAALDEHSPSKVMMRIGEYAGEGFVIGVNSKVGDAEKAGYSISDGLIYATRIAAGVANATADGIESIIDEMTKLSEALDTSTKEESDSADEATKNTSKLSEALSSAAQAAQDLVDRKADLDSIGEVMAKAGDKISNEFLAELISSSGQYAGAIDEIIKLTDEQLYKINEMYEKSNAMQQASDFADAVSSSLLELNKSQKNLTSMGKLFARTGVKFSKSFISEIVSGSGEYAESVQFMENLTDEELQRISDMFEETEFVDKLNEVISALVEDDSLAEAFEATGLTVEEFTATLEDLDMSTDDFMSTISEMADKVSDGFSKMSIKDQTGLAEYTDNLRNNMVVAQEWERNVEAVFNKIGNYPGSEEFKKEVLEKGFDKYGRIMAELAGKSVYEIMELISLWNSAQTTGGQAGYGILESLVPETDQIVEVGTNAATGLTGSMVKGIQNGTDKVNKAVTTLCKTANDIAESYFETQSFGSLTQQLVLLLNKLTEGIIGVANAVISSMNQLFSYVESAMARASELSAQISQTASGAQQVVDTTDAQNKAALLNSDMGSTVSPATLNTVNIINDTNNMGVRDGISAMSKMQSSIDNLANKISELDTSNAGTFVQNNYSPKALSTATIYRQTKNQISLARNKPNSGFTR